MATVLSTIFLFDMYALIISIVAWSIIVLYQSYDFLKTCTLALIINSPVKGLTLILVNNKPHCREPGHCHVEVYCV